MTARVASDLEAPPLPAPPASYGKLTGRLVSQGPPSCFLITSIFLAGMAIWQYTISNMVVAGGFTVGTVGTGCAAAWFWRYVNAKQIEDTAVDLRSLVVSQRSQIEWYRTENDKLAIEVKKFQELIAKWTKQESLNLEIYQKKTGELAITADEFKTHVDELEKFVNLHTEFDKGIEKLKTELREFQKVAPDLKAKMQQFSDDVDQVELLPAKIQAKITDFGTLDEELISGLKELRNYITQFESCAQVIIELYQKTKQERNDFAKQVTEFQQSNDSLEALVRRWEAALQDLEKRLSSYQELAEIVTKILIDKPIAATGQKKMKRVKRKVQVPPVNSTAP